MPAPSIHPQEFHFSRPRGALRIALAVSLSLHLVGAVSVKMFWSGNGSRISGTEPVMTMEFSEESAGVSPEVAAPADGPRAEARSEPSESSVEDAPAAEVPPLPKVPEVAPEPLPRPVAKFEASMTAVPDSKVVAAAGGAVSGVGLPSVPKVGRRVDSPSPAPTTGMVERSSGVSGSNGAPGILARPVYRKNPEPAYPAAARRRRQEGVTLLGVEVSAAGRAGRVVVKKSSGYRILDEAAVRAVVDWEFDPARTGAVAVELEIEVPVRFVLTR